MDVIANGVRLHYLESGVPAGFPVILLHGNGLSHEMWRHLEPALRAEYRVISPHFRGMGRSEAAGYPGLTFTIGDHAADLMSFMDALGIEQASLVGHAFGGFVAMQLTLDHPQRVASLVLVDTSARVEGTTRESLPQWAAKVEREGMAGVVEGAMDRWFVKRMHRDDQATLDIYRRMVAANPPMGYAANCRGIPQFDLRNELGRIAAPTLVVGGTEDYSISLQQKRDLAEGIPGARLVAMPDASHTVPEEQPELFNREVLAFLRHHSTRLVTS
jgi:3-oxoadipate enol-lactonase